MDRRFLWKYLALVPRSINVRKTMAGDPLFDPVWNALATEHERMGFAIAGSITLWPVSLANEARS